MRIAELHRELGIPPDYAASRQLSPQVEASEADLVIADFAADDGLPVRLTAAAATAWQAMRAAAARDVITLFALSGFRSVARQTEIIRAKLTAGQRIADILRLVAAPGFSEHHTGCAIDIGSPDELELDEHFETTVAFRWLQSHAAAHGFHLSFPRGNPHGIAYEPWHWCWHPAKP